MPDPDLEIRGSGHPDPYIKGGGSPPPSKFFWPLGPHYGLKIRGGEPPGPLPWIRHCTDAVLACVADVIKPRLVTSAKQRRYFCSGPQTDSTNSHQSCKQIYNGFFNRPIMAHSNPSTRVGAQTKDFGAVS